MTRSSPESATDRHESILDFRLTWGGEGAAKAPASGLWFDLNKRSTKEK
ncbi:hypothetical protein IQ269_18405 [Tychonema sp. LEGE 07199]|nr:MULTISPECIES: hypothetical protein [unclassified Tychonema]MBE9122719.1 hypothetical protein [Tychonema sp. LEGE 07199]MBE9133292.1 hypothetical protein [Tychonema sp. LEGE 07196]MBE9161998.1 hypothetical protein [Tychonema sp. LEGE 06208]